MKKTLEVTVKNGKFVSAEGEVKSFSPEKVVGNGWLLRKQNEEIEALCFQKCQDGIHSVRGVINKKNKLIVTLRIQKNETNETFETKVLKSTYLTSNKGELSGTIGLSGGNIDERYVYYRDNRFNCFLKKHKFTKYVRENPNKDYSLINNGQVKTNLFTNGEVNIISEVAGESVANVANATWVIFYQVKDSEVTKELITTESYKEVILPKILVADTVEDYLRKLKKNFKSLEDVKFYLHRFDFVDFNENKVKEELACDSKSFHVKYELKEEELDIKVYENFYWDSKESMEAANLSSAQYDVKSGCFSKGFLVLEAKVGVCLV